MTNIKEIYIKTFETINEETNSENETTYFIRGEISLGGKHWEECIFIWDGKMEGDTDAR